MIPAQDTSPLDETLLRYAGWRAVLACFLMALFLFGFALSAISDWSRRDWRAIATSIAICNA